MAFERFLIRESGDNSPKMDIHLLRALLEQYLIGSPKRTAIETKGAIEANLGINLTTNESADMVTTINFIDGGSDSVDKKNRMDGFYRVIVCASAGVYWTTRSSLRAKLTWSEPD